LERNEKRDEDLMSMEYLKNVIVKVRIILN